MSDSEDYFNRPREKKPEPVPEKPKTVAILPSDFHRQMMNTLILSAYDRRGMYKYVEKREREAKDDYDIFAAKLLRYQADLLAAIQPVGKIERLETFLSGFMDKALNTLESHGLVKVENRNDQCSSSQ